MKSKSKKAKGTRFENFLVETLRERLDKETHRTYGSGSGLTRVMWLFLR